MGHHTNHTEILKSYLFSLTNRNLHWNLIKRCLLLSRGEAWKIQLKFSQQNGKSILRLSRKIGSATCLLYDQTKNLKGKEVSLWLLIEASEKTVETVREMNSFIAVLFIHSFFLFTSNMGLSPSCTTRPTEPWGCKVKGIGAAKSGLKQKPSNNSIKKTKCKLLKTRFPTQFTMQLWTADCPKRQNMPNPAPISQALRYKSEGVHSTSEGNSWNYHPSLGKKNPFLHNILHICRQTNKASKTESTKHTLLSST